MPYKPPSTVVEALITKPDDGSRTAIVRGIGKGTVDVQPVGSGAVFRDVPLTGAQPNVGDKVSLTTVGKRKTAASYNGVITETPSTTTATPCSGTTVVSTNPGTGGGSSTSTTLPVLLAFSGGSNAPNGRVLTQGALITVVDNTTTMVVSVDATKFEVLNGKLVKSGGGTLTLLASADYAVDVQASGTIALGAATLSVGSINNYFTSTHTHAIQSTSYALTASLLATDGFGALGVQRLGIGTAGTTAWVINSPLNLPTYLRGSLRVGTQTGGAQFVVQSDTISQFRVGYDDTNYMEYTVSSTGSATIFATGDDTSLAHIYFATAGAVLIGAGNPTAKLHVLATGRDQLWLSYNSTSRMVFTVNSNGATTLSTTTGSVGGENIVNSHIYINAGGRVGFNMAEAPSAEVEIRQNGGAQLRLATDASNYTDFITDNGGNHIVQTLGSNFTFDLQPVGGLAGQKFILPANSYDINLGKLDRKFLGVYGAELVVDYLIAFEREATMGGRLWVVNSTPLAADLSGGSSSSSTTQLDITFRSIVSGTYPANSTGFLVSAPAGVQAGDLLFAQLVVSTHAVITAPGGWIRIGNVPVDSSGTRRMDIFYKIADIGEAATFNFVLDTTSQGSWQCIAYDNADTTQPISVNGAFQYNSTSDTSMTAATITVTQTKSLVIFFGSNNNANAVTAPTGMTTRGQVFEANSFNRAYIADQMFTSTGATGNKVATNGGAATSSAGMVAILAGTVTTPGTASNTIVTKHNNLAVGDILHMEARGYVEFMQVTAGPTGSGPYTYTVTRNLDGTGANDWSAGDIVVNTGQAGAGSLDLYAWWSAKGQPIEYIYTLRGTTWSTNLRQTLSWNLFGGATGVAPGHATYYGMGGGMWQNVVHSITNVVNTGFTGAWEYWNGSTWVALVTPSQTQYPMTNGTGAAMTIGTLPSVPAMVATNWLAGSQTGWAKTTVNGISAYWVRWRVATNTSGFAQQGSRYVIRGNAQFGPTITGIVRDSNVFNGWSTRFALGNLQGHYDYGRTIYGFAAGLMTSSWVAIDEFNGIRISANTAKIAQWAIDGTLTLYGTTGGAKIQLNPNGSGFVAGGAVAWDTAGNTTITASLNVTGGNVSLSDNQAANSSFTQYTGSLPDGWQPYNNNPGSTATTTIIGTGGVDNGPYYRISTSVTNSGTKGIYAETGTIKRGFIANATYIISFYAKSNTSRAFGMTLYWNTSPATTVTVNNPALSTSWQRYAFKVTWGASVDPNLFISHTVTSGWTGNIDIDHVQVEEASTLSYWRPATDELLPGQVKAINIYTDTLAAITADLGTIYAGDIRLGNQDAGTWNVATFTGLRLFKSGGTYQLIGYNAGTSQAYFDSDGKIKAGAGAVVLDASGLNIASGAVVANSAGVSVGGIVTLDGNGITAGGARLASYGLRFPPPASTQDYYIMWSTSYTGTNWGKVGMKYTGVGIDPDMYVETTGNLYIRATNSQKMIRVEGELIYIKNTITGPTDTPSGGGYLYVQSGALKYKGSSGNITTIASA